jgi:ribosome biogenesis GTPase
MEKGIIVKALSGFYYVAAEGGMIECKARGRFRLDGTSPLVGDRVECSLDANGKGRIDSVSPRRNWFIRPAVANMDCLVFVAADANPVTDPFLIDRVTVIAEAAGCGVIVCINKCDLASGEKLREIYDKTGYTVVTTSAETGQGIDLLRRAMAGRVCAFTGNSGVGKSSIINALCPNLKIETGEVSQRLGRGRHTTRHVELYDIGEGTFIADTPGFASFDVEMINAVEKEQLQFLFPEFGPYIGKCRFADCAHLREPGCAVTKAAGDGAIPPSRIESYRRLYELSAQHKSWEDK